MASGFIVLHDGRCFAPQFAGYDAVIQGVVNELTETDEDKALAAWLSGLLPGTCDIDIHYSWIRKADNTEVSRHLDLRELTEANQRRFYDAARRACERLQSTETSQLHKDFIGCLQKLVQMIDRAEKGEQPLSMSDWTVFKPPTGNQSGPGWV
jgi:hypothetical protein